MVQELPVNNFDWIEETSQFNEDNEESNAGNFPEAYM